MGIGKNGVLECLPKGFDHSVIIHRDACLRRQTRSLRIGMSDYNPIERNHFRGWFAIPDAGNFGSKTRRSEAVGRILENGGECTIICIRNSRHERNASVKILDAFIDHGSVVIHIEPIHERKEH